MGGCVGTARGGGQGSRRPSSYSDSVTSSNGGVGGGGITSAGTRRGGNSTGTRTAAKNKPLRHEKIRWKSDVPLTEGQLKSKRDEFWDTAPAFDGKEEIWAALRAAVEAAEVEDDFNLAQAILDGAGVSLPNGSLVECYDELGTRYVIPVYCLSSPVNLVTSSSSDDDPKDNDEDGDDGDDVAGRDRDSALDNVGAAATSAGGGNPQKGRGRKGDKNDDDNDDEVAKVFRIRVRVSLTASSDVRLTVSPTDTVHGAKKRLLKAKAVQKMSPSLPEPAKQRWYYGGRLLPDKLRMGDTKIPPGHVVQCVVIEPDHRPPNRCRTPPEPAAASAASGPP